ncbi:MAG: ABC transporter substrate-binding protein [Lachnospiraceae bacterium]|nr:ABC transporter substrate-binding protein [Lachnospiraceae bacterium]
MKKKLLSILLATAMVATMAGCGDKTPADSSSASSSVADTQATAPAEPYNLETLTMVVNGTLTASVENRQDAFEEQWEAAVSEKIGHKIDLVIQQQDHSGYVDAVGRIFAGGDLPDVILMSADMYAQYAPTGILWDMTEAYENAEFQSRIELKSVNEAMKIDGKLYGFAPATGNGCVTWVKKSWMDAVGVKAEDITNWDAYYDMLTKFTTEDPDGNGKNDTYGVAAAGFVGFEAPYINYLPEFWQDAYPAFVQDDNGVWYDGFNTDATKQALLRLQKAYNDGVIDPESLTMGTKDVRTKYWSADQAGSFGAFTYWAGKWEQTVYDNFETNGVNTELVTLAPLAEVGAYLNREAPVWCIIDDGDGDNSREQAVFDAFIETMLDGDTVQMLWTYGAEGVHWSTAAETVTLKGKDGKEDTVKEYTEGQFHLLPSPNDPTTAWKSNAIDPSLVIAPLTNGISSVTDIAAKGNIFFSEHSVQAPKSASSETLTNEGGTLNDLKTEVITEVVTKNGDVDQWMSYYDEQSKSLVETILAELNQ